MTRKKVKLAFIENERARKSAYNKRKRGLLKKAHELATLCDVPICVGINSAYDSNPELWPSREEAKKVVSQWMRLSELGRTKNMVNQETFLEQRIIKAAENWKKLWKENKESEMKNLMFDCLSGKTLVSDIEPSHLRNLGYVIDQHLKEINHEIGKRNDQSSSSFVSAASTSDDMPIVDMGSSSVEFYDNIRDQLQNLDLDKKQ